MQWTFNLIKSNLITLQYWRRVTGREMVTKVRDIFQWLEKKNNQVHRGHISQALASKYHLWKEKMKIEIALLVWPCLYDVKECWVGEEMGKERYRVGGEREEKRV